MKIIVNNNSSFRDSLNSIIKYLDSIGIADNITNKPINVYLKTPIDDEKEIKIDVLGIHDVYSELIDKAKNYAVNLCLNHCDAQIKTIKDIPKELRRAESFLEKAKSKNLSTVEKWEREVATLKYEIAVADDNINFFKGIINCIAKNKHGFRICSYKISNKISSIQIRLVVSDNNGNLYFFEREKSFGCDFNKLKFVSYEKENDNCDNTDNWIDFRCN